MRAAKQALPVLTLVAAMVTIASAPASAALSWSAPLPVARAAPFTDYGVPAGVSCPTSRLCVVVDTFGNVISTTSPPAGPWSMAKVLHGRLTVMSTALQSSSPTQVASWAATGLTSGTDVYGQPVALLAGACPGPTACVLTDSAGDLYYGTG